LVLAQDYLCRFAMMPVAAARRVAGARRASEHGLCLAVAEHVLRAGLPADIVHLPFVLYHRASRTTPDQAADLDLARAMAALLGAAQTGVRATQDAMPPPEVRLEGGMRRIVWPLPTRPPLVSVVIPTRDRLDLLRQCVTGLLEETAYDAIEVIIVDNESAEPATLAYFAGLSGDPRVRVVPFAGPFDFAQMNNVAARLATGPLLLLLNNDIQVLSRDWLAEMVRHVLRPRVGAVGARLLYADGRIQHAGIALGVGGIASHTYKGQPGDAPGHGNRLRAAHEVAAVTAACILIRREAWAEVGGFARDFPVAYNDVDLCLKLRRFGWGIVLAPLACLNHLESASRGDEDTPEKKARFVADKARMQERWSRELTNDPYLGPNWSLTSTDAMPATPPRSQLPW